MQYTIEKIGKAESVTSYDSEFESLGEQLEAIKSSTEKIITHVHAMVQPNPGLVMYTCTWLMSSLATTTE